MVYNIDMIKYFVASDIHGYFNEWQKALKKQGFDINNPEHIVVVNGDLFDRGLQAKQLQKFVADLVDKKRVILIKGNHEDLLLDMLNFWHRESYLELHHNTNGTVDTVLQLTDSKASDIYDNPVSVYRKMKETPFMKKILPTMVDYFETDKYVFVHGWIPCFTMGSGRHVEKFFYNSEWRNESKEEWRLARWYNGMEASRQGVIEPTKTIVCGHWHASYGHCRISGKGAEFGKDADFSPYKAKGILAIDACTAVSKKVNVVVLED
jgi:serine/threonine protein phosphatase 1